MRSMDGADFARACRFRITTAIFGIKTSQRDAYLLFHDLKFSRWTPFKCSVVPPSGAQ